MPATVTDAAANQVKIEDAGPARKKISITIPADAIDQKLQESMATLGQETVVPGFRKGKVPQSLLERRFGTAVRTEAKNQLIGGAYAEAIEQHGIKPVGEPEPADGPESIAKLELQSGRPLSFSLVVAWVMWSLLSIQICASPSQPFRPYLRAHTSMRPGVARQLDLPLPATIVRSTTSGSGGSAGGGVVQSATAVTR